MLVERHGLESRDAEVLAVGTDEHRRGAALLRCLTLRPRGDQLVADPFDLDGLQRTNGGRGVVEAGPKDRFCLAAGDLAVSRTVVTTGGDEDTGDHGDDDERHDDHDGEGLVGGLGVVDGLVGGLVLAPVHPGRDGGLARVGLSGTGGGHF